MSYVECFLHCLDSLRETISNSNMLHIKLHLLETEDYSLEKDFSYSKNTTKQKTHTHTLADNFNHRDHLIGEVCKEHRQKRGERDLK